MQTAHGLTMTIAPGTGPQRGLAARFLDRLTRMAGDLGIQVTDTRHMPDGRATAIVAITTPPRAHIGTTGDPVRLLARILYHAAPAALRPDGMAGEYCAATALWRAAMTGTALPAAWAHHGIAAQAGPDPMALALCPVLLARHGFLPPGTTLHAAQNELAHLLGCGHGRLRLAPERVVDTILVPAQLVRALITNDGTTPPTPAAINLAA